MPEYKRLRRIIESLAKEWLCKNGIISISYEKIEGEMCIVFWVKKSYLRKSRYYEYPTEAEGCKIIILPASF